MVQVLNVMLWGDEVGRLAWDYKRRLSYFTYNPDFLKKGLNISPLAVPVNGVRTLVPVWGEEDYIYQKLPSFVADSLPDSWGDKLFDLWRQDNHLSNADITPLDKLSFIGKRGMGALEFYPNISGTHNAGKVNMESLANLAERIFSERGSVKIQPEDASTMESLILLGTSAGGRQPKAIVAINPKTGEVRSGQIAGLKDFDYCLIKFGNSSYCSAELEMAYYKLATMAGIKMMPSELYPVDGKNHFMTKRFDRVNGTKIHIQTLAAIMPRANSYEQLIEVCRKLHLPETDCFEVFRRMVFNILSNNTDDHNKNFSFMMDKEGTWHLSPAYDITYILDNGGFLPNKDHCMYIRAKLRNITRDDVIQFAKKNGIRRPDAIIRDVVNALKQFRIVAMQCGVVGPWLSRVEMTINDHLKSWRELDEIEVPSVSETEINGHIVKNIHVEQAYRGNYHLIAEIDGCERKFVISNNKEEFKLIESIGISNLSFEQLKTMVEKYFKI